MSQPIIRQSTKVYTRKLTCLVKSRSYSSKSSSWFTRFLSPKEEEKLYLGITSAFRNKLVEQSNKSAKTYSHIIEHAILPMGQKPTGMLSLTRIKQLNIDLDNAGKAQDVHKLQALENEMESAHLQTVTIYNRLIRAYLWSNSIKSAETVLKKFDERGLVPTTRSFTYLIQAYLKKDQLHKAKKLVNQMKHLSLTKPKNSFDCSILLKYYQACGDTHAIQFLWRDISLHYDIIKPGTGLFTQYLEHVLLTGNEDNVDQLAKDFLLQHYNESLTRHQYVTWINAVQSLTQKETMHTAEQVLFYVLKNAPPNMPNPKETIQQIINTYLDQEQELKAIALYYKLRKQGVPENTFNKDIIQSIESAVKQIENQPHKEMTAELEGLIFTKA